MLVIKLIQNSNCCFGLNEFEILLLLSNNNPIEHSEWSYSILI